MLCLLIITWSWPKLSATFTLPLRDRSCLLGAFLLFCVHAKLKGHWLLFLFGLLTDCSSPPDFLCMSECVCYWVRTDHVFVLSVLGHRKLCLVVHDWEGCIINSTIRSLKRCLESHNTKKFNVLNGPFLLYIFSVKVFMRLTHEHVPVFPFFWQACIF